MAPATWGCWAGPYYSQSEGPKLPVDWRVLCSLSHFRLSGKSLAAEIIWAEPREAQRDLLMCPQVLWEAGWGLNQSQGEVPKLLWAGECCVNFQLLGGRGENRDFNKENFIKITTV